jgi:hypothetical protein
VIEILLMLVPFAVGIIFLDICEPYCTIYNESLLSFKGTNAAFYRT